MKRIPPQTPACIRDAGIVLEKFPNAEAFYDRDNNLVNIEAKLTEDPYELKLGFGASAEAAWADAARNVQREPVSQLPNRGSPTWSLKSDEVFWKHAAKPAQSEQSQSIPPVQAETAGDADRNMRNEGQADLSNLNM